MQTTTNEKSEFTLPDELNNYLSKSQGAPIFFLIWLAFASLLLSWSMAEAYSRLGASKLRGWLFLFIYAVFGGGALWWGIENENGYVAFGVPLFIWAIFVFDVMRLFMRIKSQGRDFLASHQSPSTETEKATVAAITTMVFRDHKKAKEMCVAIDFKQVPDAVKKYFR